MTDDSPKWDWRPGDPPERWAHQAQDTGLHGGICVRMIAPGVRCDRRFDHPIHAQPGAGAFKLESETPVEFWGEICHCGKPRWHYGEFCSGIHMAGTFWRLGVHDERVRLGVETEPNGGSDQ